MTQTVAITPTRREPHVCDVLIAERAPRLTASLAWPLVRPILYKLLNYRAAVRMAMAAAEERGHVVFCLTGIEDFNLVAHPDVVADYLDFVAQNCKINKANV